MTIALHVQYTYTKIKKNVEIKKYNVQCPLITLQSGCTR